MSDVLKKPYNGNQRVSVAAVRQLKSQITLNQHHLQAQVNLRANNDERNLFRQHSS